MTRSQVSKFAKLDPAHVLDGLFVPTAHKGQALYDVCGQFDGGEISFKGVQLSVAHQSVLLSIAARTGRQPSAEGVVIAGTANDLLAQVAEPAEQLTDEQLELARQAQQIARTGEAKKHDFSLVKTSAYSLLVDAGMKTGASDYHKLRELLHEMATVVMYRNIKGTGGTSQLLSFQHQKDKLVVSLNWRLADAIFGGQNIHVSLTERHLLSESPVAKILHTWLSAYIRPGQSLMAGHGAEVDTLIRHVWGNRPASESTLKQRRRRIREALGAINALRGWTTSVEGSHAFISRPKLLERGGDPTRGEFLEAEVRTELLWSEKWEKET
ncbi:replication protein C, IncQ-type [Giesbergeria anulus]|uniref:Plasmid and phage iteron-binding protein n=1 Tax=Giesbergeria anulus TaxID=180197 RepID=A0A1H9SU99_9BURK|nr:replication protein C, IncQ-type [Giesbergeria anulus]SER88582.1 plasmid and phage iteron-binding protein [Giesbergeria anulus]